MTRQSLLASLRGAVLAVLAAGCSTVEKVDYVHLPTLEIDQNRDLARPDLGTFRRDGVVAAPLFKYRAPSESSRIYLMIYADKPTPVTVTSATLSGVGDHASSERSLAMTQTSTATDKERSGVYVGSVLLEDLPNTEIEKLGSGGDLTLSVSFAVRDGSSQSMRFDITRRSGRVMVTH